MFKLKVLVVKNSVLHDFGFEKVSRIHETFLMELQLFDWRHFSKTEVLQNTVLTTKAFSKTLFVTNRPNSKTTSKYERNLLIYLLSFVFYSILWF